MAKKRLVTILTFNEGVLYRTKKFVPDYRYTNRFVDTWEVDEIIALDISRRTGSRERFYDVVESIATKCFVPLAVGGKIDNLEEIKTLLGIGADKVVLNSAAFHNPALVTQAATEFGAQCIVGSIDTLKHPEGFYEVWVDNGSKPTGKSAPDWAKELESRGVGEICICSIERDGSLEGYDNELNRLVSEAIQVPLLVVGGAGKWQDFVDGFCKGKADAVCTTNIYHFTESSIKSAKKYLAENGIDIRN